MSGKTARRNRKNAEKNRSEFPRFKKADDELTSLCQDFLQNAIVFDYVSMMDPAVGQEVIAAMMEVVAETTLGEFCSLLQGDPDGWDFTSATADALDHISMMNPDVEQEFIAALREMAEGMTIGEYCSLLEDDTDGWGWEFMNATAIALLGMPLRNLSLLDGVEFTIQEGEFDDTGERCADVRLTLPDPERAA